MKIKPSVISFLLRYFIFTYFLLLALFALWFRGHTSYGMYIGLWIFMTLLPALILSFKRVRLSWFFWIGLLDIIAFLPKIKSVYENLLSLSSNALYQEIIKNLRTSSEIKIYIVVSVIGILFTQLYRLSFSYVIDENMGFILIKGGIFSRSERRILPKQITDVNISRNLLQRMFRIGTVIPITSSSMGMGTRGVFGGGGVSKEGLGAFVGTSKGENIANVHNPSQVIYGVKNPEEVANKIIRLSQKTGKV